MKTAKIIENRKSQTICLPKEYRFQTDEVIINKIGDAIILIPKDEKWSDFLNSLDMFSDDFMIEDRNL